VNDYDWNGLAFEPYRTEHDREIERQADALLEKLRRKA
jgi:hypothetical protein